MALINQDLNGVGKLGENTVVPPGQYLVEIVDSEITTSKSGNQMIVWTYAISDGDFTGAKMKDRVMLSGSQKAVDMGRRRLRTMAEAVKLQNPNLIRDTEELHGKEMLIGVTVLDNEYVDQYGEVKKNQQNRINSYTPVNSPTDGSVPMAAGAGQSVGAPPAARAGGGQPRNPW